jgi:hypothetical protein
MKFLSMKLADLCGHFLFQVFFPMARQPLGGLGRLIFRGFAITLFRHTTLGRTPLDEGPARRRDLYLTTHNAHKRQTSMPPVGFFFVCPGFFPFDPFLYCLNPFVLHVTLRSTLPSLRQTQHKHPCPRWDFFFFFLSLIHFCTSKSFVLHATYVPYYRPYNKHNTNIHAPGGIRTHNPSK